MRIDLHMHSTASDGRRSPEEVVELAIAGGLDVIALTDHDNTRGVRPAQRAAAGRLRVITGVELSSSWQHESIHVLGYFVDPEAAPLTAHYRLLRERRRHRMAAMVACLRATGVRVTMLEVDVQRGDGRVPHTRPHLARALVAAGYATSSAEAFNRYIGNGLPGHVLVESPRPEEVIATVLAAGGVPVWAHPPVALLDSLLPPMVEAGLVGLEVHRPWPARVRDLVSEQARRWGLLATGGSDWHGRSSDPPLGTFSVPEEEVSGFLAVRGPADTTESLATPAAESSMSDGSDTRVLTSAKD